MKATLTVFAVCTALVSSACAHRSGTVKRSKESDRFYKSGYVRRCLQYEKERLVAQAEACWNRLLQRLDSEPSFAKDAGLTAQDTNRIRRHARDAQRRTNRMKSTVSKCIRIGNRTRDERIACLRKYLHDYDSQLSRSERFEVENMISELERSKLRAEGKLESTLEHSGRLLGMQLSRDAQGVRIESLNPGGPAARAGLREQGLIVLIGDTPAADLEEGELVALLESCSDRNLELLVRYGDVEQVGFVRARVRCGPNADGTRLWEVNVPEQICTGPDSPELSLGIGWCYHTPSGIIEVQQVCADSPAARAGVVPGLKIDLIQGKPLLGANEPKIRQLLGDFPAKPVELHSSAGILRSPGPITGPPLDERRRNACWQAIMESRRKPKAAE
ncbi:MAG: hypothetical protein D6806_15150 [Deltaproteobacteria bacterium]|nr:MAG: hypothetical protein D6806_15150 [Deltaproteobacteria bacterium]